MIHKSLRRSVSAVIVAVLVLAAAAMAQVPSSQHVVLVIDENSSFSEVMANMPWLVGQGDAYGYASNYESDNGGSLFDYLWLASGSCHSAANCKLAPGSHDFNCTGNDCYYPGTTNTDPITDNNIFRDLNNAGISWKVYAQSYTAAGGTVTTPDNNNGTSYYRRHNGATWYSDIQSDVDGSASKIVDLSQLSLDIVSNSLPRFMIIVPDGNHDAHDCPVGMATCTDPQQLAAADSFLNSTLDPILSTSEFLPGGDGLIFITFDECGEGTDNGCGAAVYTALIGPRVRPHTLSTAAYKHENGLRTILDSLGMTNYPGAAATATDMSDFFTTTAAKPEIVVSSPADGASISSPVCLQASAFPTVTHAITGWAIYVDSVTMYTAGAVNSISACLNLSATTHTVDVRAWDSSGASGDQILSVAVAVLQPTVTVSTPVSGATVGSPVNILASATPTAGHPITGWWIYVDGNGVYNAGAVAGINANVAISAGAHTVIVRSWDTSGAYGGQTLPLTSAAQPAVSVSTPAPAASVISPISIQASAVPSSGHSITGWHIYLDGVSVYSGGAVGSISSKVSASTGTHTLVVRAWDSSKACGDQTFTVQVQPVAVNLSTPANGASVNSPINIAAAAASGNAISAWQVYVDSVSAFAQNGGNSINANLIMSQAITATVP